MSDKVRVLVVDDQFIARGYFEMYIKVSVNYELAGSLPAAEEAVEFCETNTVDLILMDIMMRQGIDGLTAAEQIKKKHPKIKIILATSTAESTWESRARKAGIDSFWYKEYAEAPLLEIMDRTMSGERVYPSRSPQLKFGLITKDDFTKAELNIIRELTIGRTNEEIADILHISVNTVRWHIQNMLSKTGFRNRLELALNAKAVGLVVSESDRLNED